MLSVLLDHLHEHLSEHLTEDLDTHAVRLAPMCGGGG